MVMHKPPKPLKPLPRLDRQGDIPNYQLAVLEVGKPIEPNECVVDFGIYFIGIVA